MNLFGKTVSALLISGALLQSGCGSNFEWFPKGGAFSNSSTSTATKPGTVMRELPYPANVQWVSDISYDRVTNTFWMLAWTQGLPPNAPNSLVKISAVTGDYISKVDANTWPFTILDGSTLVFDGTSFWITSNGSNSGVAASEVYQILSNGMYFGTKYNCPATSTGFCQGLAFDSSTSSYWSAGSDNTKLVNYQLANNSVASAAVYSNGLFAGASDISFDAASGEAFVVNNGILLVNKSNGAVLGSISFSLPGAGRGDWDGTYFWVVDNGSKSIKALFVR